MTVKTKPTGPDQRAALLPELLTLAPVGGKRHPVQVVEHPAFRTARVRAALDARVTVQRVRVLRLPVVSLDVPAAVASCGCPTLTAIEAA